MFCYINTGYPFLRHTPLAKRTSNLVHVGNFSQLATLFDDQLHAFGFNCTVMYNNDFSTVMTSVQLILIMLKLPVSQLKLFLVWPVNTSRCKSVQVALKSVSLNYFGQLSNNFPLLSSYPMQFCMQVIISKLNLHSLGVSPLEITCTVLIIRTQPLLRKTRFDFLSTCIHYLWKMVG